MTSANLLFTIAGIGALIAGLVMLLRPALVCAQFSMTASEPAITTVTLV